MGLPSMRRRWLLAVSVFISFLIFGHLLFVNREDIRKTISNVPLHVPGTATHKAAADKETLETTGFMNEYVPQDHHPISKLMAEADKRWRIYEESRSHTFSECVATYRRQHGRHPPPLFDEWYKFARAKGVHNVDDFEQIMSDLRPFWAIQPRIMRSLAGHMWETTKDGISGIHIRNHKVEKVNNPFWRSETFTDMIQGFIKYLPDMDIPMNRMDQPRVVVPWDDMQGLLAKEESTRELPPEVVNEFSTNMTDMYDMVKGKDDGAPRESPEFFNWAGKQFMDIGKAACPPESHANRGETANDAEAKWKDRLGGVVTNFNLSSDLCTMGPEVQQLHGFLYSASSLSATRRLVPVFNECKVNVNNDILFPANMYWKDDKRYKYNDREDLEWEEKEEKVLWRGVTSGGIQLKDNWQTMHRQRFVQTMNHTVMAGKEVRILTEQPEGKGDFENFRRFQPEQLLSQISDVGFTEPMSCVPNCSFYDDVLSYLPSVPLPAQFRRKFLVDVDGHSFSGRWRAFLQSKSLGVKSTIFREWHDSRLFAWRHFVPMDNRYDDIFSLLTYFMGTGDSKHHTSSDAYVARHDLEAKRIALRGREWAHKVLRNEDIEIYTFRLLLEYARLLDDNRDRIGYSGDGSELDHFDKDWAPIE